MRWSSFARSLVRFGPTPILLAAAACNSETDPVLSGKVPSALVTVAADSLVFASKGGRPFVLANLSAELHNLQSLTAAAQEEYVLKRALVIVTESALPRKEYGSAEHFGVRLILLTKLDEYGRPKWGEAGQLALLELDRGALQGLKPAEVDTLSGDRLRGLFTARQLSLECIAQASKQ